MKATTAASFKMGLSALRICLPIRITWHAARQNTGTNSHRWTERCPRLGIGFKDKGSLFEKRTSLLRGFAFPVKERNSLSRKDGSTSGRRRGSLASKVTWKRQEGSGM